MLSQNDTLSALIYSCINNDDDRNQDLIGHCGFYILTNDENILKFYLFHKELSDWLLDEIKDNNEDKQDIWGKLYVMRTNPDGNCLIHAISICLWGVEDTNFDSDINKKNQISKIRKALKYFMLENKNSLYLKYKLAEKNFEIQYLSDLLCCSDHEYLKQFNEEIAYLDDNKKYLSAIHIYSLSNMLKRPIIVYAEQDVNGIMRGIYLPTLYPSESVFPCPLTILWKYNHFSAVISSECGTATKILVPLFDSSGPLEYPYECECHTPSATTITTTSATITSKFNSYFNKTKQQTQPSRIIKSLITLPNYISSFLRDAYCKYILLEQCLDGNNMDLNDITEQTRKCQALENKSYKSDFIHPDSLHPLSANCRGYLYTVHLPGSQPNQIYGERLPYSDVRCV